MNLFRSGIQCESRSKQIFCIMNVSRRFYKHSAPTGSICISKHRIEVSVHTGKLVCTIKIERTFCSLPASKLYSIRMYRVSVVQNVVLISLIGRLKAQNGNAVNE